MNKHDDVLLRTEEVAIRLQVAVRTGQSGFGPNAASSPRLRLGANGVFAWLISAGSKQVEISTSKIFLFLGDYGNKGILTESSSPIIRPQPGGACRRFRSLRGYC